MKKLIFFVDDDEDDRELLLHVAQSLHCGAEGFSSGDELLTRLTSGLPFPDMIFLDLTLPKKDGFEVLAEIRATGLIPHIPVVINSGRSDNAAMSKALGAGATAFIVKPSDYSAWVDVLTQTIDKFG